MAYDPLVQLETLLERRQLRHVAEEPHQHIIALIVAADVVGEWTDAPLVYFLDRATVLPDGLFVSGCDLLILCLVDIGSNDIENLVSALQSDHLNLHSVRNKYNRPPYGSQATQGTRLIFEPYGFK
jgi:hypothetical protein